MKTHYNQGIFYLKTDILQQICTLEELVKVCCEVYSISYIPGILEQNNRHKNTIIIRRSMAWILREIYQLTYQDIAQILGYKDHTTSLYHYRKYQEYIRLYETDKQINTQIKMKIYEQIKTKKTDH